MPKLTASDLFWLRDLSKANGPLDWKRHLKAKGNKFVRLGLAEYRAGYPVGFCITPAGREFLQTQESGDD